MDDRTPPSAKKERYLTTGQVAERCGVNFRTVIRWVQQGYLKAYRLPGARADHRIPIEDFERFMRDHQQGLGESAPDIRPILVVDDDLALCRTLKRILGKTQREVLLAHDGFTAGLMLNEHRPALVTLDLKMKGVDGMAVLRSIRGNPVLKQTLVLVISGDAPTKLAEAITQGADAALPKPFKNQDLISKVEELLTKEVPMPVKRVLVVEDDINLSAAIYRALRHSFGAVDLTWVSTEEDAERELALGRFDAVISDYLLASAGDGVDLWRHCVHFYPALPFILVSAVPFEEILARFKAGEPEPPLLPKPFRISEIIDFFEEAA